MIKEHGYPMVLNVRAAPPEHRPRRPDPRHGATSWTPTTSSSPTRSTTAGPTLNRESAAAHARAARARRGGHQRLPRPHRRADEDLLRGPGLLREPAEGVHERLGLGVPERRARRRRAALPRGAHAAGARASRTCASHDLRWIWFDSPGFNRYRGDGWMKEPCRSCPEKGQRLRRLPLPGLSRHRRGRRTPIRSATSRRITA